MVWENISIPRCGESLEIPRQGEGWGEILTTKLNLNWNSKGGGGDKRKSPLWGGGGGGEVVQITHCPLVLQSTVHVMCKMQ